MTTTTATNRVSEGTEITGSIKFKGELIFEGKFKGDLIEGSHLIVGEHAEVHARTILLENLTSSALVDGRAEVYERCYLKATAHFQGSLNTFRLAMDDGATFSGGLTISKPANIAVPDEAA